MFALISLLAEIPIFGDVTGDKVLIGEAIAAEQSRAQTCYPMPLAEAIIIYSASNEPKISNSFTETSGKLTPLDPAMEYTWQSRLGGEIYDVEFNEIESTIDNMSSWRLSSRVRQAWLDAHDGDWRIDGEELCFDYGEFEHQRIANIWPLADFTPDICLAEEVLMVLMQYDFAYTNGIESLIRTRLAGDSYNFDPQRHGGYLLRKVNDQWQALAIGSDTRAMPIQRSDEHISSRMVDGNWLSDGEECFGKGNTIMLIDDDRTTPLSLTLDDAIPKT